MKKLILKVSFVFLICQLGAVYAFAQQRTITGTVTVQQSGEPLAGVNIVVTGTTIGTSTNGQGNYSLEVPAAADTLTFLFIGYKTLNIPINNRSEINVAMKKDLHAL